MATDSKDFDLFPAGDRALLVRFAPRFPPLTPDEYEKAL